jgi:hypothetical protein
MLSRVNDALRLGVVRLVTRFDELPFAFQAALVVVFLAGFFIVGHHFGIFPKRQYPFVGSKPPLF